MVKCRPAMQETRVQSLSWEDPLEKETATHSSTLAWKIPWIEEPGRLQSKRSQRVGHNRATSLSFATHRFNLPIESLSFDSPMLNFDFVIEMLSHCQSSTLHLIQLSSLLLSLSLSFFFFGYSAFHVAPWFCYQGWNLCPQKWNCSLNRQTAREVMLLFLLRFSDLKTGIHRIL